MANTPQTKTFLHISALQIFPMQKYLHNICSTNRISFPFYRPCTRACRSSSACAFWSSTLLPAAAVGGRAAGIIPERRGRKSGHWGPGFTMGCIRRKIRMIECNSKCRYLKKWPVKGFAAGVLSLCDPLPSYDPIPPLIHRIRVYSILVHTGKGGGGKS